MKNPRKSKKQLLDELSEIKRRVAGLEALEDTHKKTEEKLRSSLKELERSNRELERFAYVASHDLREPLIIVDGFLRLLQRRCKGRLSPEEVELISSAMDSTKNMQALVNDLLEYSRVIAPAKTFERVNCSSVLDRALANLRAAVEESGAVVTSDTLPEITANATQLAQLFQNLIGNAIKFRSERPLRIHISSEQTANERIFSVRDNGIGIPPEHMQDVFIIFKRLHIKYPGTGIGLSICKRIVEGHGGRIWVESEPGKGSTFYFAIPDREC